MTGTLADVEPADPSPAPRRPRVLVVSLLGVVLLVAGVWVLVAAQQRAQVAVWFDAQPLECIGGAAPAIENLEIDLDPILVHVVDAAADLDCWLRVQVENRGRLPVTVKRVELPMYGPATGGGIRARELSPFALSPNPLDETGSPALDAVYALEHRLEADDRLVLRIGLVHQPDGCMSPDTRAWLTDAPVLDISVLGLGGERAARGIVFAQRGTPDSSCDVG